jgi:NodT family efflux transporter outer membrane factor (OMF) lipoprotein
MKKMFFLAAILVAVGCSVGPDYIKPDAPVPSQFKELQGWREARPRDADIPSKWWELFADPVLSDLVQQVTVSNQNIALAESRYRQALAQTRQTQAAFFPTVGLQGSVTRSRTSSTGFETTQSYSTLLSASWEIDLWGKVRRQVEAGEASAWASLADLAAMRLSMQTDVVVNYYALRTIDKQKKNLEQAVEGYRKALELTQNRYTAGVAAKADVIAAQTQLKSTEAQVFDLALQRAKLEHAIAILTGRPPSSFSLPAADVDWPDIAIPVSLPSDLLERRPDIASAERAMAAANAKIGVAQAAYYPSLTLSGSLGYAGVELGNLFTSPHFFWAMGPAAAAAVLFDGGARAAQTEQARAAYDGAVASYRQTVLSAFQAVEDQLAALRILAEEAQVQKQAVEASRETVQLTTNQYKAGTVSYLNVVTAQTIALSNERTAISIEGQRRQAAALLIKALGGGWKDPSRQGARNPQ